MPRLSRFLLTMLCLSLLATASPGTAGAYTVQAGDTPLSIAKKHNISVDDLLRANKGLKPSKMKVGDTLTIPGGSSSKAEPAKDAKKDKVDKKSESGTSSRKERAAEDRDRRQEKEAKSAPAKGGGHYTVKKGDTLGGIASKHGVSVDDLLKANKGLNPSRMGVGQEIALPGGPAPAAKAEPAEKAQTKSHKAAEPEAHTTTTYTAHRKDTVDSVARKFHVSPKELARLNPDMGKKLHSGQKLVVPLSKGKAAAEEPEEAAPVRQAPSRQAPAVVEEPAALPEKPSRAKATPEATPSLPESRDTADAEAAFEKGIEFGKQNKFQKAVESFDKAIKLNPNRADYFASRGHANYYLKQYPKAIDDYTKAIEKNPNFALAYSMRGLSRTRTEKYQQAIEDFNKAISFGPNEADYYKGRGFTYLHLKQYGPMCQDYQKACTLGDCELLDSAKKEKLCQ